jgi:hypothetical protein
VARAARSRSFVRCSQHRTQSGMRDPCMDHETEMSILTSIFLSSEHARPAMSAASQVRVLTSSAPVARNS